MTKEEKVVNMIKEGTYTREEILNTVGVKPTVLASYLTGMRSAAKFTGAEIYPVEVLDEESGKKLFKVMTMDDALAYIEAHKKPSSGTGKARTPIDKLRLAKKRLQRAATTLARWEAAVESDPDHEEANLRLAVAQAEHNLAEFLYSQTEEMLEAAGEDVEALLEAIEEAEKPQETDEIGKVSDPDEADADEDPWD